MITKPDGDQKKLIFGCIVFLAALLIRLAYFWETNSLIFFNTPIIDAEYHHTLVQKLLRGENWMPLSYFRAPLYFYFLAAVYYLLGISIPAARLVQLLIGSFNCLLLFWLTLKVFQKPSVALVAGLLMAFYGPIIYFDGELLLPVLLIFWDLLFALCFWQAWQTKKDKPWWFLAGLLLGLSAITRPNVLIFVPVVFLWTYFKRRAWASAGVSSLLFILGVTLVVAPVTTRNYLVEKDFVLVASQGGICFYIGNNPVSDGSTAILPYSRATWEGGYVDSIRIAEKDMGRKLKSSEVSAYWTRRTLAYIKDQPGHWLKLMWQKTLGFWHGVELGNNKNPYFSVSQSRILNALYGTGLIWYPFGIIAPLAWGGLVFAGGFRRQDYLWLTLFILTYSASFIIFLNCDRYRLPIIPHLLMFAALFIFWSVERLRRQEWLKLTQAGLFVGFLLILLNAFPQRDQVLNFSQSYCNQGNMYAAAKDYKKAIACYLQGASADPTRDESFFDLALLYYLSKDYSQAEKYITKALALAPDLSDNQLLAGQILLAKGETQKAETYFKQALVLNSYEEKAYLFLGEILFQEKRWGELDILARQFVTELPQNSVAHYNLGNLHYQKQQYSQAAACFQEAIQLQPANANAFYMLGLTYLQMRDVQCKQAWENYLRLAPDCPEAPFIKESLASFK